MKVIPILLLFLHTLWASSPPKKLLLYAQFTKSHQLNMVQVAAYLSSFPSYEVHMLFLKDSQFIQQVQALSQNKVKPIVLESLSEKQFLEVMDQKFEGGRQEQGMADKIVTWMKFLFEQEEQLIRSMRNEKYDLMIIEHFPDMDILASAIKVPTIIKLLAASAEPLAIYRGGGPLSHSSYSPMLRPLMLGYSSSNHSLSYFSRAKNWLTMFLFAGPFDTWMKLKFWWHLPYEFKEYAYRPKVANLTLFIGAEGIGAPLSLPPNQRFVYPLIKKSGFEEKQELESELKEFVDKHQKLFLISFGSVFLPKVEQLDTILKFAIKNENYGFIVSLRSDKFDSEIIAQARRTSHIYISNWIPQKELLSLQKTVLFLSHGGFNSYLEALESETALITWPVKGSDQKYNCELVELKKVGACITEGTLEGLQKKVKEIEVAGFNSQQLHAMQQLLEHKSNSSQDLVYWIEYSFEVGLEHLHPKQEYYKMGVFKLFDLDVHLSMLVLFIVTGLVAVAIGSATFKWIFGIKNDDAPPARAVANEANKEKVE